MLLWALGCHTSQLCLGVGGEAGSTHWTTSHITREVSINFRHAYKIWQIYFNKLEEEINHLFNKVSSVSFSSLKKKQHCQSDSKYTQTRTITGANLQGFQVFFLEE